MSFDSFSDSKYELLYYVEECKFPNNQAVKMDCKDP